MTIFEAYTKAFAQVENVVRNKGGQVGNQKYKYATLEDVLNMMRPILAENKLAACQYVEGDDLKTILYHASGDKLEFGSYGLGALSKQQERGSAITYGRRYVLCAVFGIAQEDDDGASADAKPLLFKNSALRKEWCSNVVRLIDESCNNDELQQAYKGNSAKLLEMKGGHEYDVLAYDDLMQRFSRKKAQLAEELDRLAAMQEQLKERE